MKKSLIISIVLIVLLVIVSGILVFTKNEKNFDKKSNDIEEKEVLSNDNQIEDKESGLKEVNEEESSVNDSNKKDEASDKKKANSTRNKNIESTKDSSKKSDSQNSSVNNKSIESKRDENDINQNGALAMYYKSISCSEEESDDGYKMTINYIADFPAYKGKEFSKETEMENSVIEMIIILPGYEQLEGEVKQEFDDMLDELKGSMPGYVLNFSHQSDYINYTWTGDKKDFLNVADDFESNKVTYNNYLSYFKKQGIACKES